MSGAVPVSRQPQANSRSHVHLGSAVRPLDGLPAESASALERWLDELSTLPFDRWLDIGRACARDASGLQQRATARALLDAIVADQRIELTAWFIHDMVRTVAHPASVAASRARRSERRDFAMARSAADWAALAIATQAWLPRADLDALRAPFDAPAGDGALRLV
jgi:hypothetical protein